MGKPALKLALENVSVTPLYRSKLEEKIAGQLEAAGIKFQYENKRIPYKVPARDANYKPDFNEFEFHPLIIIEGKGHFGANNFGRRFANMTDTSAKERQKFALLKEQHPELDIRFVFSRAAAPIYKGSKTTHAKWAEDHGFKWAEKVVPQAWLDELKTRKSKR